MDENYEGRISLIRSDTLRFSGATVRSADRIRRISVRGALLAFNLTAYFADWSVSPQIVRAVVATSRSLSFWSSTDIRLPEIEEAKPHCGLSASRSSGTSRPASQTRPLNDALLSNRELPRDSS